MCTVQFGYIHIYTSPTEAVCGEGRIPYSDPRRMKSVMVGLPADVSFQQPAKYTAAEIRQIHDGLDRVQFLPLPPPDALEIGREEVQVTSNSEA